MSGIDPKAFWERKIVGWEAGRYEPRAQRGIGPLEWIADRASMSLRFRLQVAIELLRPFLAGKRVIELGCGTGILAGRFIAGGATSYLGVDIAETAISAALRRKAAAGWGDAIGFTLGRVGALPPCDADLVISLGLLDWLTDAELEALFAWQGSAEFLHAIAERRASWQQWLHRSYVHLAYGRQTGAYRPRYFDVSQINRLADRGGRRGLHVYRDRRLSFGALISTLPIAQP